MKLSKSWAKRVRFIHFIVVLMAGACAVILGVWQFNDTMSDATDQQSRTAAQSEVHFTQSELNLFYARQMGWTAFPPLIGNAAKDEFWRLQLEGHRASAKARSAVIEMGDEFLGGQFKLKLLLLYVALIVVIVDSVTQAFGCWRRAD